jgi:hypothetical protein
MRRVRAVSLGKVGGCFVPDLAQLNVPSNALWATMRN